MNNRKLIKDTEFLVIDFETITPKGRSPEPIEVGVLRISNNQIDEKASVDFLIKPPEGLHLTDFDTMQTGIKEKDLAILLAKYVYPRLSNYKLDTLANTLGLPIPKDRHRALADCFLTADVFLRLLEIQKQRIEIEYLDELLEIAEIETSYGKPKQLNFFDMPR